MVRRMVRGMVRRMVRRILIAIEKPGSLELPFVVLKVRCFPWVFALLFLQVFFMLLWSCAQPLVEPCLCLGSPCGEREQFSAEEWKAETQVVCCYCCFSYCYWFRFLLLVVVCSSVCSCVCMCGPVPAKSKILKSWKKSLKNYSTLLCRHVARE